MENKKKFHKLYKAFNYPILPAKVNSSDTIMFGAGVVDLEQAHESFMSGSVSDDGYPCDCPCCKNAEQNFNRFGKIIGIEMVYKGEVVATVPFGTS